MSPGDSKTCQPLFVAVNRSAAPTNLSVEQEADLVMLLAFGTKVSEAAALCDTSERTVYRRLADPAFKAQVFELQSSALISAAGKLTDAAHGAAETLDAIRRDGTVGAAVRMACSRAILELLMKLRQSETMEQRLKLVEDALRAKGGAA